MSEHDQNDTITFDLPKNQSSVIKVLGVGGGGSNAVNHMFGMGIRGVDFAVCNTDAQALTNSPVPNKIQLGVSLTEGLGAGANPEIGQQAAQESITEIKSLLETNTKMVFITAGMGGGTGTGAAPVIAKTAKDMGILTVGIVTMPFLFEGSNRKQQAENGIEALRKNVDSLIVINNNKLREVYGNLGFKAGFAKADEVLATAARGIAEVITHHYKTNIDLRDARTVLADSGTAIMGSAHSSGENRAADAITRALDSPLLNDNHIKGAKNVLLLIVSGTEEITIDEIGEINDHIQAEAGGSANIIMGIGEDESLDNNIAVTIVATGFNADQQVQVIGREPQKVIHTLEDEQPVSTSVYSRPLRNEEPEEDDLISRELARAQTKNHTSHTQADLFSLEEDDQFDSPVEKSFTADNPKIEAEAKTEAKPAPEPTQEDEITPEDEEREVSFDIKIADEEDAEIQEKKEEIHADTSAVDEEEADHSEPIFSIEDEVESQIEDTQIQVKDSDVLEECSDEMEMQEKSPEPAKRPEPIRYSLEDYMKLEEQLKSASSAKPIEEKKKVSQLAVDDASEDEDLKFEVKKVDAQNSSSKGPSRNGKVNPEEHTIAQSMSNRARERSAALKAFNYRFKNNPYGTDDVASVPAYKRQGVNIDNEKYSTESKISRFTIDDDESGGNIKTNNSFLHDNVD